MSTNVIPEVAVHRNADHEVDAQFLNRWSPRSFSDKPVDRETLLGILEAARWAPSGSNLQPWRFIVAQSEEERQRFYPFILEGNLIWCTKAPVLILVVSNHTGPDNSRLHSHAFDTGAAWGYLALEAARRGLITHAMGGFNRDQARAALGIPDEYDPQIVLALGYRGPKEALTEAHQARELPSGRRPLSESVFFGKFQKE